jgi:hypothetical protein
MSFMKNAAAIIALTATGPALAGDIGLLGLYKLRDIGRYREALGVLEKNLVDHRCALRREGEIAAMDGPLKVPKPDRFLLLECTRSLLKQSDTRALFGPLRDASSHLMLTEGELQLFEGAFSTPGKGREYIIKVSHFTNGDPDRRDRDLASLQKQVEARPDRYRNEAMLTPSRAMGMTTPDEVVVLSYDDPKAAERFRRQNPDILDKIGAFNKTHLVEFAYFGASSTR